MTLEKLFHPASIAIVGVSHEPQKVGHLVAKNILDQGYQEKLYFINQKKYRQILGKKVYPDLPSIKHPVDLVILAIPADACLPYLDQIYQAGIKNVIIYAAGFKETDASGQKKEEELRKKAKAYGINLLGPNCIGFINTGEKINATFLKNCPPAGNIGFISQSGALGSILVDYFVGHKNLGLSYFISLGNKTMIDESDCLEFLGNCKKTSVIGLYIEDVKNGHKFQQALRRVAEKKPVIILKAGATEEGSRAALSHTGGLVGNDQVFHALFKQNGAVRADNLSEFYTLLKIFSFKRLPSSTDVLVLSNAGGAGVLLADELIKNHLSLTTISKNTKENIVRATGGIRKITLHNPIDLLGDAGAFDYHQVIASTLKEKDIGSIIVLLSPQANTQILETARVIAGVQSHFNKPIYPVFMGEESVTNAHHYFEENKMASFFSFDSLPACLKKIIDYQKHLAVIKSKSPFPLLTLPILANEDKIGKLLQLSEKKPFLNLIDSMKLLQLIDIPTVNLYHAKSYREVKTLADKLGFPLVLKIASNEITHKTEIKGVITSIKTPFELKQAFDQLKKISPKGCFVQKMVFGHEIFLGAKRDQHFGPVIVIGLGGIYTELYKDIAYRIFPFDQKDFIEMINETKLATFLRGFRKSAPLNAEKLFVIAVKIGFLLTRFPLIKEVDINPLFVLEKSVFAVDGRIIINTS